MNVKAVRMMVKVVVMTGTNFLGEIFEKGLKNIGKVQKVLEGFKKSWKD